MKSENNGKIAVAIVAMFVVALSIVGFTYAYFTAQVKGNAADKSVEVNAGELKVTYGNGTTIQGNNVVPGWISDGEHYYDTEGSKYIVNPDAEGEKIIGVEAITKSQCVGGKVTLDTHKVTGDFNTCDTALQTTANGIAQPATFTVANNSTDSHDAMYMISIRSDKNTFNADAIKVSLYKGTAAGDTTISSDKLLYTTTLGATGSTKPLITEDKLSEVTIGKAGDGAAESKYYFIVLEYPNTGANQDAEKGASVEATVVVNGIALGTDGNTYYNDNNEEVTFAS